MLQGQCAIVTGSARGIGVRTARSPASSRVAAVPIDAAWLAH
jgi:NAD(P)-dependent dehydrogenase (short-subunit alcohol dehydrogenase family)